MKNTARILALLMAMLIFFVSCDFIDLSGIEADTATEKPTEQITESLTEDSEESITEEKDTESETKKETGTEPPASTEAATDAPLTGYRATISRSRAEIESMITLTDSDFEDVKAKLDAFEEIALVSSDYEAVDAVYMEFEDAF